MILTTKRLILRPFLDSDAGDVFAYARDPRVGPAAGWEPHKRVQDSLQAIRTSLTGPQSLAIVLRDRDRVIGSIVLSKRPEGGETDELGFALHPDYWGRGLVPEAAEAVLAYGFETLGLRSVWCTCFQENNPSRRVLEKLGFTHLFDQKEEGGTGGGRTVGVYLLLREDWRRRNRNEPL